MEIDFSAACGFNVERADLPGAGERIWQFPRGIEVGADGPLVQVRAAGGEPWLGRFAAETYGSPPALPDRMFAMPDGASFCVLAGGRGYIVSARDPEDWIEVDEFPITCLAFGNEIVAFGGFSGMTAYSGTDEVWSAGLCLDDLAVMTVSDGWIEFQGYEMDGTTIHGRIRITTGRSE